MELVVNNEHSRFIMIGIEITLRKQSEAIMRNFLYATLQSLKYDYEVIQ